MRFYLLIIALLFACSTANAGIAEEKKESEQIAYFKEGGPFTQLYGYKDIKFGMPYDKALELDIVKEGVVLFGERREISPASLWFIYAALGRTDTPYIVDLIEIKLGEFDQDLFNKLLDVLNKKYKATYIPNDIEINRFNNSQEIGSRIDWHFEKSQILLEVIKANSRNNLNLYYCGYEFSKKMYKQATEKLAVAQKKTTTADF